MEARANSSGNFVPHSYRERTQNWWTTDENFTIRLNEDAESDELPGTSGYGHVDEDLASEIDNEKSIDGSMRSRGSSITSGQKSITSSNGSVKRKAPSIPTRSKPLTASETNEESLDASSALPTIDLHRGIGNRRHPVNMKARNIDANRWISADPKNGYLRVYCPNNLEKSQLIACTTETPAYKVCFQLGVAPNALHVQYGDGFTRRIRPNEPPLLLQNDYLFSIGYEYHRRVQKLGTSWELAYLIRIYSGGPIQDGTFTSSVMHGILDVHKGKMFKSWTKCLCVLNTTRLFIYKDTLRIGNPLVLFLEKGEMSQFSEKNREFGLRVTSHLQNKTVRLSFADEHQCLRWEKQIKKAITKLPTTADLSDCNLEALPEPLFSHGGLLSLNLRKNIIRPRPNASEGGQLLGWLEDIARFSHLKVLNLADNDLREFPKTLCQIATLTTLNLSSNKIPDIPREIILLRRLESLHVHNNYLVHLPREITQLSALLTIVLAFNRFEQIPEELCKIGDDKNENIIMAGNRISRIEHSLVTQMQNIRRIDLRFNKLTFEGEEAKHFHLLTQLNHLDLRDNMIENLDLRCIKTLEYIYCQRNRLYALYIDGARLKVLNAAGNVLELIEMDRKPEWVEYINISRNKMRAYPDMVSKCLLLRHIDVSYNHLTELPSDLFTNINSHLRILSAHHNGIKNLPDDIVYVALEELYLQHNWITSLPQDFLKCSNKLRVLNVSKNRLVSLPPLHAVEDKNKVQELYLSFNYLRNNCFSIISGYLRLKILNLSHNRISLINPVDLMKLEFLRELNISGNRLQGLPKCILQLQQLHTLRAHSNALVDIPGLNKMESLKVLDLGCNHLRASSIRSLVDSKLNLLDISCNQSVNVSMKDFGEVKNKKKICLVDMTGENRSIPGSIPLSIDKLNALPFAVGLAETSGQRNRLHVSVIKKLNFPTPDSATFAMFDGGHNNTVPKLLQTHFPFVFMEELKAAKDDSSALKYTTLTCHKKLKAAGQRLGASSAICYLKRIGDHWRLNLANAGDVEVVVSQGGLPVVLSRRHRADDDREEAERVMNTDGIITEDGKLNGTSLTTRMVGCNYLFPQLLPDPHVASMTLTTEDDAVIIANRNLWSALRYEEAVYEVNRIRQPVVAAKRLMDLAQSYGSIENIAILVLRFTTGDDMDPYSLENEWRYDEESEADSFDYQEDLGHDSSLQSIQSLDSLNKRGAQDKMKQFRMANGRFERQRKPRMYMKKHETDELDLQLRMRLTDEVKTWEMDALVRSLSDSTDLSIDDCNWSTALSDGHSSTQKFHSYLGQTYTTMTQNSLNARGIDRGSAEWNVDMRRFDRIGDAAIGPPTDSECSSVRSSINDISEESSSEEDVRSEGTVILEDNEEAEDEFYVYNKVNMSTKSPKPPEIVCTIQTPPRLPPRDSVELETTHF